ncbi:hypothetical protein IFM89_010723 [Coptis chinensis]|uniref:sucrose synthase n=1 Tax=Coptis chinensis TaxID=261450 RepID=A0A835INX5_9MAGN|nr:hypothetical protein IFM89_010723 [Coptis chinensis]
MLFMKVESFPNLSDKISVLQGPGCSSLGVGAFSENGPFRPSGKVLVRNEHSWNKASSTIKRGRLALSVLRKFTIQQHSHILRVPFRPKRNSPQNGFQGLKYGHTWRHLLREVPLLMPASGPDLYAMNHTDFIITSTFQEIVGSKDTVGQYGQCAVSSHFLSICASSLASYTCGARSSLSVLHHFFRGLYDLNEPTIGEKLASLELLEDNKVKTPEIEMTSPNTKPPSADLVHVLLK